MAPWSLIRPCAGNAGAPAAAQKACKRTLCPRLHTNEPCWPAHLLWRHLAAQISGASPAEAVRSNPLHSTPHKLRLMQAVRAATALPTMQ